MLESMKDEFTTSFMEDVYHMNFHKDVWDDETEANRMVIVWI